MVQLIRFKSMKWIKTKASLLECVRRNVWAASHSTFLLLLFWVPNTFILYRIFCSLSARRGALGLFMFVYVYCKEI